MNEKIIKIGAKVVSRLEKIERAVELKGLGQPQAEIDKKQAAPVASLLKAVEKFRKQQFRQDLFC